MLLAKKTFCILYLNWSIILIDPDESVETRTLIYLNMCVSWLLQKVAKCCASMYCQKKCKLLYNNQSEMWNYRASKVFKGLKYICLD